MISLALLLATHATYGNLSDFGTDCSPPTWLLTTLYVVVTVSLQMLIGIVAALSVFFWAERNIRKLMVAIAILTMPYAIPSTIGFTMFEFLLAEGSSFQQLVSPDGSPLIGRWSRFGLMCALAIWQFFPFTFLMLLAAFLAIPRETLASARSDGASRAQIARHFLIPLSMPVFVAAATIRTVLMLTKLDAPLAFRETSSSDFACLLSVRIYTGLGLSGIPLGLILLLCAIVAATLVIGGHLARRAAL